jgi:hypothetical protein
MSRYHICLFSLLLAISAASAQEVEPVLLYFDNQKQAAMLHRGPSGDTLLVVNEAAREAVRAGQYDLLRANRTSHNSGFIWGGAFGAFAGFVWHFSEGGSVWDFIDLSEDDNGYYPHETNDWRGWRVAVGIVAGGLAGAIIGSILPENRRVSFSSKGLEIIIADGLGIQPTVLPHDPSGEELLPGN